MKIILAIFLFLYANISLAQETQVRVLIYHRVSTEHPPSQTTIDPQMFKEHMDLIKSGYTTVTISQLTDFINGKISLPEKSVAITFDDGWKDNLDAANLLIEHGLSATFYVLSGVFGDSKNYMSKEDIVWLSKHRNFEIGAHSHTHFMEWEGKMDLVDDRIMLGEIAMSKSIIEDIIKRPVTSFAWPFGYWRDHLFDYIKSMGFTSTALVNRESKNSINGNPLRITRINIDGNCNKDHLQKILEDATIVECKK